MLRLLICAGCPASVGLLARCGMAITPPGVAFPTLTGPQLDRLHAYGSEHHLDAGEYAVVEGQDRYDFIVILDGELQVLRRDRVEDTDEVIATHGPGRFLGELGLLTGQRTFLRIRASTPSCVLRVDPDEFRRMLNSDTEIADIVFAAFVARREILIDGAGSSSLRIIGSRFSRDALDLRSYVRRQRVAHTWIDLDSDDADDVEALLAGMGLRPSDSPVVITPTSVLRQPSVGELAADLGLVYQPTSDRVHDVVVIGAGPAGLAAAVYGASEGLDTLVIDRTGVGGQAGTSSRIENYVGFPSGVSGGELVERAALQAQRLGAQITSPCEVVSVESVCDGFRLTLGDGETLYSRAAVAALGVQYRKLPIEGLERFEGQGVYYAATDLEARVCGSDPVTVVGGGNSAGQAAIYLGQNSDVTIAIRGDDLTSSMSSYLIDRIEAAPNITVTPHSEVVALHGEQRLESVTVEDNRTGERSDRACAGLFSFIGAVPFTGWLDGFIELDDRGFILTDVDLPTGLPFEPLPFETSRPGFFAAGDIRTRSMKRVAAAVGEGSSAIRSVHDRLANGVLA